MGRGIWSGKQTCPICGRSISKRGFAWRKHEATHPELVARRRAANRVFKEALRIADEGKSSQKNR